MFWQIPQFCVANADTYRRFQPTPDTTHIAMIVYHCTRRRALFQRHILGIELGAPILEIVGIILPSNSTSVDTFSSPRHEALTLRKTLLHQFSKYSTQTSTSYVRSSAMSQVIARCIRGLQLLRLTFESTSARGSTSVSQRGAWLSDQLSHSPLLVQFWAHSIYVVQSAIVALFGPRLDFTVVLALFTRTCYCDHEYGSFYIQ